MVGKLAPPDHCLWKDMVSLPSLGVKGKCRRRLNNALYGGGMIACSYPKAVHVREYPRFRLGKWEHVCEHCRSYPGQLSLFDE